MKIMRNIILNIYIRRQIEIDHDDDNDDDDDDNDT